MGVNKMTAVYCQYQLFIVNVTTLIHINFYGLGQTEFL